MTAVLALLCAPAAAAAQSTGEVAGSISDQTGAPLPGVRMTIRGVADRGAETSAAGEFVFGDLPEGDYEISAELSGFERTRRAVRVRAGERVTVSFTLHVAIVEETIVTAAKVGRAQTRRRFRWRSVPSQTPSSGAWERRHWARRRRRTLGHVFSEQRFWSAHDPRDRRQRCVRGLGSKLGDVPRRRLPRSTRRWRSCSFSIWIASKCFEGRRARCTDAMPSVGR